MLRILYLMLRPSPALLVQCEYAILSALAFGGPGCRVHLYSDMRDAFPALANFITRESLSREILVLDPFEAKLAVIADATLRFATDSVLFVDADTFFIGDSASLDRELESGRFLLHRPEYAVFTEAGGQMRRFRRALRRAGWPLSKDHWMWNSGVVGLPAGQAPRVVEAQSGMRKLLPFVGPRRYLAEQFAISCALPDPMRADSTIFHYWFQKADYTVAVRNRLDSWRELPIEKKLNAMRAVKPLALPALPQKLHLWERLLHKTGLRQKPADSRGLPL